MPSQIIMKEVAAAEILTPAVDKKSLFVDVATGDFAIKDETGIVTTMKGTAGAAGAAGAPGTNGTNGTNGVGVPVGGTAGQQLAKIDGVDYNTAWVTPAGGGGGGSGSLLWKREISAMSNIFGAGGANVFSINCTTTYFGAVALSSDSVGPYALISATSGNESSAYTQFLYRLSWKPDYIVGIKTDADITSCRVCVGLVADGGGTGSTPYLTSTKWIGFRYNPDVNGNWHIGACNGGGGANYVAVDTGIAVAASTRYSLRMVYDGSVATFYINGVSVGTVSTFLPDSTAMTFVTAIYGNGATRIIGWDGFSCVLG